jgi:hypothetical protein
VLAEKAEVVDVTKRRKMRVVLQRRNDAVMVNVKNVLRCVCERDLLRTLNFDGSFFDRMSQYIRVLLKIAIFHDVGGANTSTVPPLIISLHPP